MIKKIIKWVLSKLFTRHQIYQIYASLNNIDSSEDIGDSYKEVTTYDLGLCTNSLIKEQAWYGGDDAKIFACYYEGKIVGICCYWYGDRYKKRNFWPLNANEAKLVQIIVIPEMRGKGMAAKLIEKSTKLMHQKGFENLYARIWHSNHPSLRCFQKAGWKYMITIIEFDVLFKKNVRFELNQKKLKSS